MRLKEYDSGLRRDVSLDRPNLTDDIARQKDVWLDQFEKKCNNGLGCNNHEVCVTGKVACSCSGDYYRCCYLQFCCRRRHLFLLLSLLSLLFLLFLLVDDNDDNGDVVVVVIAIV